MPVTRKSCKRYLSPEKVQKLLMALEGHDRLIARMLIVCALRAENYSLCVGKIHGAGHSR
jgi:hypothetical protein